PDAGPGDAVQRQAHDRLLLEFHLALALAYDAHDGAQGGGLADTVAAKQRDRLTGVDIEIDAMQRMALAIPGLEVAHLELRRRAATPRSLCRCSQRISGRHLPNPCKLRAR